MPYRSNAWRHQPSVCVFDHMWRIATRAARAGCVLTDGSAARPYALRPSALAALSRSACETPLMMKAPRLNFVPPESNGSSVTSMSQSFNLYLSEISALSPFWLTANSDPAPDTPLGGLTSPITAS